MRKVANLLLIVCLVVVFTACESRTDQLYLFKQRKESTYSLDNEG